MNRLPKIAWIIPCYNEEHAIGQVIAQIQKNCPEGQITIFDNCSTDRTQEVARTAGAHVLPAPQRGKGNVVRLMFELVDADIYLMVDGDSTYEIEKWRDLVGPILKDQADMVVGTRLQTSEQGSFRRFHSFGNRMITTLINVAFQNSLTDILSGYRAFNRRFVKGVGISAQGFEIEVEMTIQALENRFRVEEVPTRYGVRAAGTVSKLRTYHDGTIILFTILRLIKDYKPLTFFGTTSALLFLLSIAASWEQVQRLSSFFTVLSAFSFFTGLILNSISQRFKELSQVTRKVHLSQSRRKDDVTTEKPKKAA